MNDLNISPDKLSDTSTDVQITVNNIPTKIISMSDEHGLFFAILDTDPELSNICGDFVFGKLIKEINYLKYQGQIAVIKSYYD